MAATATVRGRLGILGGVLLTVGLCIGLLPVLSSDGAQCGAAFYESRSAIDQQIQDMATANGVPGDGSGCDGVRSAARAVAIPILLVGGAAALGAWAAGASRKPGE